MLTTKKIDVDFNGMIIFCYPSLLKLFDRKISDGDNILEEFTATDKGDEVLDKGIALPTMGIHDGTYEVRFFINESPKEDKRNVIFSDKNFFLNIENSLYLADMAVFFEWEEHTGWEKIDIENGIYSVCIEGVSTIQNDGSIDYSYDIILNGVNSIGIRDIEPRSDSRLF